MVNLEIIYTSAKIVMPNVQHVLVQIPTSVFLAAPESSSIIMLVTLHAL